MERTLQPTPLPSSPVASEQTPAGALASCRKQLAQARAQRFSGIQKSTNAASVGAHRAAEKAIAKADAEIRRLQAEERRLTTEVGVASLQADLPQHFPAIQQQPVLRRYPESQA